MGLRASKPPPPPEEVAADMRYLAATARAQAAVYERKASELVARGRVAAEKGDRTQMHTLAQSLVAANRFVTSFTQLESRLSTVAARLTEVQLTAEVVGKLREVEGTLQLAQASLSGVTPLLAQLEVSLGVVDHASHAIGVVVDGQACAAPDLVADAMQQFEDEAALAMSSALPTAPGYALHDSVRDGRLEQRLLNL